MLRIGFNHALIVHLPIAMTFHFSFDSIQELINSAISTGDAALARLLLSEGCKRPVFRGDGKHTKERR